jgi:hypothetical protein
MRLASDLPITIATDLLLRLADLFDPEPYPSPLTPPSHLSTRPLLPQLPPPLLPPQPPMQPLPRPLPPPATPTAADADAATAPTAAAPATPTAAAAVTPSPRGAMPLQAPPLPPVGYPALLLLRVLPPLKPPGIRATTSPPSIRRFLVPLWLSPSALQSDKLYSAIKIAFSFSPVSQIEKPIWLSVSVFCRLPPASTAKRTMVLRTNACLWLVSWLGPGFLSISRMDMENPYGISIWIWTVWTYGLRMAIRK